MVLKMRKSDFDMDTVTNIILNNEYDLHEKEEKIESPKEENMYMETAARQASVPTD